MIGSYAFITSTQVRPLNSLHLVSGVGRAGVGGEKADNGERKQ